MSISSVSSSVAAAIAPVTANKPSASNTARQASKPVAPVAVQSAANRDRDHDGSGGGRIDVKA